MLLNELSHESLAFGALNIDDFDTSFLEILLATNEGVVLTQDYALDLVQYASASAHVTW